jgi:hypothetical protein
MTFHSLRRTLGFLTVGLFLTACQSGTAPTSTEPTTPETTVTETPTTEPAATPQTYLTFNLNTHDWVFPEDSAASVNKVIDIHERYKIPVDIYLTDPMVQLYVKSYPDLIKRLKTSPYVAVSYHTRPPSPYATSFDFLGLQDMSAQDRYDTIYNYETHAVDISTGQATSAPGGYAYLKELMGYPPYVAVVLSTASIDAAADKVWKTLGAQFTLTHSANAALGDEKNGLYLRPETVEVKAYEQAGKSTAEKVVSSALAEIEDPSQDAYINIKWHEDNFYASDTPWNNVYFENGDAHGGAFLTPPWNTGLGVSTTKRKNAQQTVSQWKLYEDLVKYVSEHQDTLTPINAKDLAAMLP